MFHELIKKICDEWYQSEDCKIKNIIHYIVSQNKLRDAQIESIKLYLFFKIYCKNQPLEKLFNELGPRYVSRNGGYTRGIKAGVRKGDNAKLVIVEFVK